METIIKPGASIFTDMVDAYHARVTEKYGDNPVRGLLKPKKDAVFVNSNDYLNLSGISRINRAHAKALLEYGGGVQQSSSFIGRSTEHPKRKFESDISSFMGYPDAELCQSGFCANLGLLQSISKPDTIVYLDSQAHYSFLMGIYAGRGQPRPFRHNSPESLETQIKKFGPGIICVDSIYSSKGTIAPLVEMSEIAKNYGCVFVVDESHSLGIMGPEGRGMVYELGLQSMVHFVTASLAKAFVSRAGVILGNVRDLEFLRYTSSPAVFSSVVEPFDCMRCQEVLSVIKESDERRDRLNRIARYLRKGLESEGIRTGSQSHIIPLLAGTENKMVDLIFELESRNIFGAGFCPPATGKRDTLVRLSLHSELSTDDVDHIIDACLNVRNAGII